MCYSVSMMTRTQIQLHEDQARRLKRLAADQGRSMADLIREAVAQLLSRSDGASEASQRERALAAVGRFRSGLGDVAEKHDEHLNDAYSS